MSQSKSVIYQATPHEGREIRKNEIEKIIC